MQSSKPSTPPEVQPRWQLSSISDLQVCMQNEMLELATAVKLALNMDASQHALGDAAQDGNLPAPQAS